MIGTQQALGCSLGFAQSLSSRFRSSQRRLNGVVQTVTHAGSLKCRKLSNGIFKLVARDKCWREISDIGFQRFSLVGRR